MKTAILGIVALILVTGAGGVILFIGLRKDIRSKGTCKRELQNAYHGSQGNGRVSPGSVLRIQSASSESDKWQEVMRVKGDEPIPIRHEQLGFVAPRIGYGFIGSYYMVTANAGHNWSIWDAQKKLPGDEYQKRLNLSPYIEEIQLQPDGTGRMRLHKYFNDRAQGPDLFTSDYGLHWFVKE